MVHDRPDLGRRLPARREDSIDIGRLECVLIQYLDKPACTQLFPRHHPGSQRDAQTSHRRCQDASCGVYPKPCVGIDRGDRIMTRESPTFAAERPMLQDAVMLSKLRRAGRHATRGQICRRCDNDALHKRKLADTEGRVFQRSGVDTNGEIPPRR